MCSEQYSVLYSGQYSVLYSEQYSVMCSGTCGIPVIIMRQTVIQTIILQHLTLPLLVK